jgi:mannose-6-phosphate isomerase-like protein (cupin superfamily)
MAKRKATKTRRPVRLAPGEGREYAMGPLRAVFKADGDETNGRYSISEWWLEPRTKGPGAHQHDEDDVFYVLEGTMSVRVGTEWIDAKKGAFVLVPGGVLHDFENRTNKRAGILNVSVPGDFESDMPGIAQWFRDRSPADARTTA